MSECEVCGASSVVGVAAVPGVPYWAAYCRECLAANAHPWRVMVANTAAIDGLEHAAEWWRDMVEGTLTRLGRTRGEFQAAVRAAMEASP